MTGHDPFWLHQYNPNALSFACFFIWQQNSKSCPFSQLRCYIYPSLMFFYEFSGNEQTEAGTLALFGTEKGLKKVCPDLIAHTGPIIFYLKSDNITFFKDCPYMNLPFLTGVLIGSAGINGI